MAQARKKTATKTTKRLVAKSRSRKPAATRTANCKCKGITGQEKIHVYFVTAMAMIAGILLCANAAMMIS